MSIKSIKILPFLFLALSSCSSIETESFAPKPLFRDPIYDGAADVSIIKNRDTNEWEMFYTNRRATLKLEDKTDVSWVHATPIGIATSKNGNIWKYKQVANFPKECTGETLWAPELYYENGVYHIWLTIVPGVFKNWKGDRFITHLTSDNLRDWKCNDKLELGSKKVIDAGVIKLPNNKYRLWFKDELAGSRIFAADSDDLVNWKRGDKIIDRNAEGPKVFEFKGKYWLIADIWQGLMVLHSNDALNWTKQEKPILLEAGLMPTDKSKGQHPDIIVIKDRAFIFYFVHQNNEEEAKNDTHYHQRTVIQVAEIIYKDGELTIDRNAKVNLSEVFK